MSENVQAHVIISGRVQGVYFRMETKIAMERLGGITGFVRNLPDRSVEAVFEGEKSQVQKAVDWCWKGSPMSKVTDVKAVWGDYTGKFGAFDVTY